MSRFLLDTSVAALLLYGHSPSAAKWFDTETKKDDSAILASRLLRTELTRVLRRDGIPVRGRDEIIDHLYLIPLTEAVLAEAEAIVPHIKTLDAIHLASLIHTGLDAIVVTHDATMKQVAELIGYETFDPIET
ncbi:Predicted nucleic acid-binding protein, contains PIN domain [Tessaracoccus bendigoensis DSM 12906]|uniref:Predicted nucleic acid-binding protein, contains PIN domain n=1 Tax=Tessaracoccus bendigoensis DSM 12906 TaxID=1123357 RepID=A0A1M6F596_9ACTN|nr:PIN domain-containing protein [Tessaracoccus bendigoensis]SHI92877.1 Predicted nucleic acid-binding protein, contains PIN domain [Tessaracoccus bendigoensis DSM 12906]